MAGYIGNYIALPQSDDRYLQEGDNIPPSIGSTYVQFPNEDDPGTLWPDTTWQKLFDSEGVFFRTEGGDASLWESGVQTGALESHRHTYETSHATVNAGLGSTSNGAYNAQTGVSGFEHRATTWYTGGGETRPINRTIRIWERIA